MTASWRKLALLAGLLDDTGQPPGGGLHPNLATHDALGLATDAELATHAATAHGLAAHAIDGAYHTGTGVLPSAGQKNALAGTSGTPGAGNPYVTDADARLSDARTPAGHSHVDGDLPAGLARDSEVAAAVTAHEAAGDPHPTYLTGAEGDAKVTAHEGAANPHPTYETSAEAAAKVTAHEALADPHPGYLTPAEGNAAYEAAGAVATHAGAGDPHPTYETSAEAAAKVTAHEALADPHPGYLTPAEGNAAYRPIGYVPTHAATTGQTPNDHHAQVHAAADHTDRTRKLFLMANDGKLDAATAANLGASPDLTAAIAYADAATQGAFWTFLVPADWTSGNITIQPVWSPGSTDAVAHTVRWSAIAKALGAGINVATAGTTVTFTGASAARTASVLVYDTATSLTIAPAAAGDLMRLELRRIGADAADTYVGVVNLIGVIVSYTADQ